MFHYGDTCKNSEIMTLIASNCPRFKGWWCDNPHLSCFPPDPFE